MAGIRDDPNFEVTDQLSIDTSDLENAMVDFIHTRKPLTPIVISPVRPGVNSVTTTPPRPANSEQATPVRPAVSTAVDLTASSPTVTVKLDESLESVVVDALTNTLVRYTPLTSPASTPVKNNIVNANLLDSIVEAVTTAVTASQQATKSVVTTPTVACDSAMLESLTALFKAGNTPVTT